MEEVAEASVSELMQVGGIGEEKAGKIIESAIQGMKAKKADERAEKEAQGEDELKEVTADGEG
jgi:DNA uptake protein ComE-like DNA-binding protein